MCLAQSNSTRNWKKILEQIRNWLLRLYFTKFSVTDYKASTCREQNVGVAHDSLEIDTEQYVVMGHDLLLIERRTCAFSAVHW